MTAEIVLMWCAVTAYAVGGALLVSGTVFGMERTSAAGLYASVAGLVPHAAAIAMRWARTGHAPFLGFYEVVSSLAFVAVAAYAVLALRQGGMRPLGVVLVPLSFLAIAGSMLASKADEAAAGKLASWWLNIHVTFAKLSYAAFAVSFALAVVYLWRDSGRTGRAVAVLDKMPAQEIVDDLSFRFVAVGTIFLGIMVVSGAIWANEAWGGYWAWDPIETWSLVSWLVYAGYLHARLTLGWQGRKAAWLAVVALPVVVFSLIGVPIVYKSMHGAYLQGLGL